MRALSWVKDEVECRQVGDAASLKNEMLARHDKYFEAKVADTRLLLETAHALRYQVYCLERKFENPEEHQSGLEFDAFDGQAIHGVLFHKPTNSAMGTVRMIVPGDGASASLPIMGLLNESGIALSDHVKVSQTVEISRFAISKEYRRRKSDEGSAAPSMQDRRDAVRDSNLACLSLIQFLLRQSVETGVMYWTAVMEPKLLRMLAAMGIQFTSIGSLVMHHGLRQPCFCYVPTMLEEVRRSHPDYWEVLTDGGTLDVGLAGLKVLLNRSKVIS